MVKNKAGKCEIYIKDHKEIDEFGLYQTRLVISTKKTVFNNFIWWIEKILHKFLRLIPMVDNDIYRTHREPPRLDG